MKTAATDLGVDPNNFMLWVLVFPQNLYIKTRTEIHLVAPVILNCVSEHYDGTYSSIIYLFYFPTRMLRLITLLL